MLSHSYNSGMKNLTFYKNINVGYTFVCGSVVIVVVGG